MFIRTRGPRRPVVVVGGAPRRRRRGALFGVIPVLIALGVILFLIWRIMNR